MRPHHLAIAAYASCLALGVGVPVVMVSARTATQAPPAPATAYVYNATVTNVVDGDTVDASIDVGFNITTHQRLRMLRLDTPEKFGATKEKGLAAKAFTRKELEGKAVVIRTEKSDVFGRWLAEVWVGGRSFNQRLLDEGWAVPFDGK